MSKLYFRTQYQQRKLTDLQTYRIWVGCLSVNALVDDRVVKSLEIDRQMPHLSVSLYLMSLNLYICLSHLVHKPPITAHIALRPAAVHQVLFRQGHQLASGLWHRCHSHFYKMIKRC